MTKNDITKMMEEVHSPKELARKKYEAYKTYVLQVLDNVKQEIERESFSNIEKYLFESPSGDGWGLDNHCIDFGINNRVMDIYDACQMLQFYSLYSKTDLLPITATYIDGLNYFDVDKVKAYIKDYSD